jgi:hypothetical protein
MKRRLLCKLGWHQSVLEEHRIWQLWDDVQLECVHCGQRKVYRCDRDNHWSERHDERVGEVFGWWA